MIYCIGSIDIRISIKHTISGFDFGFGWSEVLIEVVKVKAN